MYQVLLRIGLEIILIMLSTCLGLLRMFVVDDDLELGEEDAKVIVLSSLVGFVVTNYLESFVQLFCFFLL
jgi:hypothetical protein